MKHKLTYRPDPPDSMDQVFTSSINPEYKAGILRVFSIPEYTPISQQGGLGSCVANAVCDAFELVLGARLPIGSPPPQLSRLGLYTVCRQYDGTFPADAGTYCRTGLRQASKIGCCLESDYPYVESLVGTPLPTEMVVRASENRLSNYRRIVTTGAARSRQIQQAIAEEKPVIFGTIVGSNFDDPALGAVLSPPSDAQGGHAMVVVGYRYTPSGEVEFRIRNSWGTAWGENGYTWFTESYMTWDRTSDLWVVDWTPDVI